MKHKLFTWSDYTHWHFKLIWPSDGSEKKRVSLYIGLWHLFIDIPLWKTSPWTQWDTEPPQYGVGYHDAILWIYHGGDKWITIDMPWQWEIVRWDLLLPNGQVFHRNTYPIDYRLGKESYKSWYDVFEKQKPSEDITRTISRSIELDHHTKKGLHQVANIRLTGEEREWRWKWFKWLPFPRKIQRTVDCHSDVELGERAGSWKGGMMGWGCEWREGESMQESFWRWYKKWDGN